jgi:hypothetical protein
MATHTYSPAQILVAAGRHVPSPPEQTPADWEVMVENMYGTNARMVFTHGHVPDLMDPHVYNLLEPVDCEDLYLDKTPMDQLTRLALARALERQGNGNTKDTWKDKSKTLDNLLVGVFGAGAAGQGRARGKAKAKANAKGKAKAKAKA